MPNEKEEKPTDDAYTVAQIAGSALRIARQIKESWSQTAKLGIYKDRTDKKNS